MTDKTKTTPEKECECRNWSSRLNGKGYVCDKCGKEWEYGENIVLRSNNERRN